MSCADTPGWLNNPAAGPAGAWNCAQYVANGGCAGTHPNGKVLRADWVGAGFNNPQTNCCACGGGTVTAATGGGSGGGLNLPFPLWVLIVIVVVAVLLLLICICCCYKRSKAKKAAVANKSGTTEMKGSKK